MRPALMLFVGVRSARVADTCAPLAEFADVVVATSADILSERSDALPPDVLSVVAHDRDQLVAAAMAHADHHRVDGALTFSEDLVEATAAFAEARGLPGLPTATIDRFVDKHVQRDALAAAGLRVPAYQVLKPGDPPTVPFPAIVKPTRGSGGALAFVVASAAELDMIIDGMDVAATGAAVRADTGFILEELLVGTVWHETPGFAPYVSVETAAVGGRFAHLAVTDRFPLAPPVLETGMMLPSGLTAEQQERVVAVADAALTALGFHHGIAHTELMLTADGPVVIEVNARAGGALPYLFALAADLDLVAVAGRAALGELPPRPPRFTGHAVFVAPQHPVGVEVTAVHGLDEVAELPGVRAVIPLALAGTRTADFRNTMIAVVLGTTPDPGAAVRLWSDVQKTTRGEYAPSDLPAHFRRTPTTAQPVSRSGDSPRTVFPSNPVPPASTLDAPAGQRQPTGTTQPARHAQRGATVLDATRGRPDSHHHTPSADGMSVATDLRTGTPEGATDARP